MDHQLAPGALFGTYHIVRPIGGGGMAQIYLAKTQGLAGFEKFLALKVINPEYANEERFVQMLIDEAKITVGLSHVNIAQVFDLGAVNGIYYIAMEYVDGRDVLELVNGLHAMGERLPIEAVAYVARQICSGLHYAHSRRDKGGQALNIVHRDISPQNILVSRNGEVKVVDFGIAKAAGMSTKTQAGVIKGKVNYMAPEQALGQKADRRTDIFATGIVMWEMLTSQMVYNGNSVNELVAAVRKADIPAPSSVRPEIPKEMDRIVLRSLSPRPDDRYQTAHELQVDLTRFLSTTAPDYSGSNLSLLVERVIKSQSGEDSSVDRHFSRDDLSQIENRHSLIVALEPGEVARVLVNMDGGESSHDLGEEMVIGRAGELTIADARVSRQHARIYRRGDDYLVEDLGSSNGTFVNDQRLTGPRVLAHGDRIGIGSAKLLYVAAAPRKTPQASAPAVPAPVERPTPRLLIVDGDDTFEAPLDKEAVLRYQIRLGPLQLMGESGRLSLKEDGFWLEPSEGRVPITYRGTTATKPLKLAVGDSFEIGGVVYRIANQTRPLGPVARNGK